MTRGTRSRRACAATPSRAPWQAPGVADASAADRATAATSCSSSHDSTAAQAPRCAPPTNARPRAQPLRPAQPALPPPPAAQPQDSTHQEGILLTSPTPPERLQFEDRVAFIGLDAADERSAAEQFLREVPPGFPSIFDPDSQAIRSLGGGRISPTTSSSTQRVSRSTSASRRTPTPASSSRNIRQLLTTR